MSRYTREIHTPDEAAGALEGRRNSLRKRHQLLRVSQSILFSKTTGWKVGTTPEPQHQHRTVWCRRHVVTEGAMPLMRKLDGSSARLGKLKTCGSVWACPVCAAKVAEQRRRELNHAMVAHVGQGGHAYLLTFTFPHYVGQGLDELMEPFTKARQSFQNCKSWKKIMELAGKVGVVNSLEVTYGSANGWHPHLHMLVFCGAGAFAEGAPDERGSLSSPAIDHLRDEWVRLLERRNLVHSGNRTWARSFGLDVRGGHGAAEYIAKWGKDESWGLSSELTSAHAKTGKRDTWGTKDHYTPFQLLSLAQDGDTHAICAFREFVRAFDGKRMLTWSRGLKEHFGIEDMDDETASAEPELALPDEAQAGEVQQEQLQVLTKYGQLGDFLVFMAKHGHLDNPQQLIDDWIAGVAAAGGRAASGAILVDRMHHNDHRYWFRPELVE